MACTFQASIGGKFAPLIGLRDYDMDRSTIITTCNTAMTDAALRYLGGNVAGTKPWVTRDILDFCEERRDLKKRRN